MHMDSTGPRHSALSANGLKERRNMRNEDEIREELERLKKTMETLEYTHPMYQAQNSRLWTLRWVLEDKNA